MARVLLIDDDDPLRAAMRLTLEAEGYEVDDASDGMQGLDAYRERRADVVVCDLVMPGSGGAATIAEILQLDPGARVILISGYTRDQIEPGSTGRVLGAVATLDKPFGADEFLDLVRRVREG